MSKVTINPVESNEFKPFELIIRVDNEEELAVLWSVFNTSINKVIDNSSVSLAKKVIHYFNSGAYDNDLKTTVWRLLNARIKY